MRIVIRHDDAGQWWWAAVGDSGGTAAISTLYASKTDCMRAVAELKVEGPAAEKMQHLGGVDRYRVGLHHLALAAPSRAIVDERHEWLVSAGAEIESTPREYGYGPGYYAVFFYDPDGIKLEIVHVPGLAA
jgi:catechol 2,3-dioxygenase-like lactoylglutathione lyase family enzyme